MISEELTIERVRELQATLTSLKTDNKVTVADLWAMTVEMDDLIWSDMHLWYRIERKLARKGMDAAVAELEKGLKQLLYIAELRD